MVHWLRLGWDPQRCPSSVEVQESHTRQLIGHFALAGSGIQVVFANVPEVMHPSADVFMFLRVSALCVSRTLRKSRGRHVLLEACNRTVLSSFAHVARLLRPSCRIHLLLASASRAFSGFLYFARYEFKYLPCTLNEHRVLRVSVHPATDEVKVVSSQSLAIFLSPDKARCQQALGKPRTRELGTNELASLRTHLRHPSVECGDDSNQEH